jgi:Histidine kinase
MTDLAYAVLSGAGGMLLLITRAGTRGPGWIPGPASAIFGVDAGLGLVAAALFWFRRRWPTGIAVAMLVPMVLARSAQVAGLLSVLNVTLRRRPVVAVAVAGVHQVAFIGFSLLWITYPWWAAFGWVLTYHVAIVALGLYVRARRGLVTSLHEQVRQAEATQHLMADGAQRTERARIAVEMHDVLAHRVSLIALHAGGLEVRPDLPPREVRETAQLIGSTARQALAELRDVIGVLRDTGQAEAPRTPQPWLGDIEQLVAGYRQAGLDVALDLRVAEPGGGAGTAGPGCVPCRARGPGQRHQARRRRGGCGLAVRQPGRGPAGVSLAERVALAGGTLAHGPDGHGDFVLTATLRWEA